jgi:hypothetical protein
VDGDGGDVGLAAVLRSFEALREVPDGAGVGPFRLACSLSPPAAAGEVEGAWGSRDVPDDARLLWATSRESRLFEDVEYGQWGLVLLSPAASAARTAVFRSGRPRDAEPGDVVIGEFRGDLDVLVLAPGSGRVLVALPLDRRSDWYDVAGSLAGFLDRYRAGMGEKYWEP